jgi:signal transduction histidine kinase
MAIGALEHTLAPALPTRYRRIGWAVFAFVVVAIPTTFMVPSSDAVLGVLGVLVGHGVAGYAFVRGSAVLEVKEGRAWRFVGFGYLITASGVLVVAAMNAASTNVRAFGPQDIIFMAGYATIFFGLGRLPHVAAGKTGRVRVWLDGLIGAVSLAAVMWVLVLADLAGEVATRGSIWERIAGFGYPLLDTISLIVIMIVVARRSSIRFDVRLLVFALALIAQTFADLTFLTGLGTNWDDASPVFGLYLIAVAGYVLTSLLVTRRPRQREYAERTTALLPMVAPYGAAAALVGLLFFRIIDSDLDTLTIELLVATLLVGALVVARQAVAIRENRQLVERERAALVSSISHELRTPLTAMMGFLEILDEEAGSVGEGERRELTEIVHDQAIYMSRIVADLIMLARGGAADLELAEVPVNIRQVIDSAIAAVSDAPGATDVSCASALVVRADPDRMQQVLVNLLANAVRYGGDYRAVVARVERDDVVIEVHDNGPGVPPRFALRIWERFERGPNRYNAVAPGSGIGLAVVDAVTRAHGGSASYERSLLLGGACFRIRLPARRLASTSSFETTTAATSDWSAA